MKEKRKNILCVAKGRRLSLSSTLSLFWAALCVMRRKNCVNKIFNNVHHFHGDFHLPNDLTIFILNEFSRSFIFYTVIFFGEHSDLIYVDDVDNNNNNNGTMRFSCVWSFGLYVLFIKFGRVSSMCRLMKVQVVKEKVATNFPLRRFHIFLFVSSILFFGDVGRFTICPCHTVPNVICSILCGNETNKAETETNQRWPCRIFECNLEVLKL